MSAQCLASRRRSPSRATRAVLVTLVCLLAAACASAPAPRPLASGFAAGAGVADPYADGKRHLDAGRYELAAQRFGEAVAGDRRSLDALNGLGIAYTRLGRFDAARTQFERALQIDPTSALTLNNYGWSLLEQGRLREARAFLEQARRHATEIEAPVIAANLQRLHRAPPPALLAALDEDGEPQAQQPRRLVRVDHDAWRLDTAGPAVEPLLPSDDASAATLAAAALQQHTPAPGPGRQPTQADGPAEPSADAQGVAAVTAAARSAPAGPAPDVAPRPSRGGPIRLWPPRSIDETDAEADPIHAGDEA